MGFAKLIGEVETEEEKQQFIDIIDVNSELLLQLINDILDISKIEAGTLEFRFRPMNLNDLCRSELEVHKPRVKPGVELVFEERVANVEIVCDQNRLAQVISNLLNNAGKFTEEGEIRFGFDLKDGCVEFFVQDTGMGIPPEKARNIFDRFVKLNDFAAGTGLGLAISKMIVEKLDGTIGVDSEPGKGTRFHFSIPVVHRDGGKDDEQHCAAPGRDDGKSWVLLVAEDSDTNFRLIEAVLSRRFSLVRAHTGAEAVDMFGTVQPDAVLMDIRMPVMDGLEATRRIRSVSADVPIIAMSAYSSGSEIESARNAGCNEFLVKPLSQYSLHRALNAALVEFKYRCEIRVMNSSRVRWSERKIPVKAEVVVADCCFSMPRICMHMWLASITTATPMGFSASWMQSRICTVSLSCTCRRRAKHSTTRAILESPVIWPLGM